MVAVPKLGVGTAISVAQAARDVLRRVRKKPTAAEAKLLVEFARRLEEHRVFSAPFDAEIVESCLSSLDSFKAITEDYLAKIEHPRARAALGAMLTSLRRFLDSWHGFATRRIWDGPFSFDAPRFREERRTGAEFFQDLDSLRTEIRILVELLVGVEPKISVPCIMRPRPSAGDK